MNEDVHLKLLVPFVAAGAIIGKGGESVETIKRLTGARLKMSKANDFYPGTTERVCLIIGNMKACMQLCDYVMQKVTEKPESVVSDVTGNNTLINDRHRQVKILVPNTTAGVIIGKSGSFIKKIKDESGAFVQISQKPRDLKLMERCIIITGTFEERRIAVSMILSKIAEDPDSASCPNCSYIQFDEPVASAYPTGSPYANGCMGTIPGASGTCLTPTPFVECGEVCTAQLPNHQQHIFSPIFVGLQPPEFNILGSPDIVSSPGIDGSQAVVPVKQKCLFNMPTIPPVSNSSIFFVPPPGIVSPQFTLAKSFGSPISLFPNLLASVPMCDFIQSYVQPSVVVPTAKISNVPAATPCIPPGAVEQYTDSVKLLQNYGLSEALTGCPNQTVIRLPIMSHLSPPLLCTCTYDTVDPHEISVLHNDSSPRFAEDATLPPLLPHGRYWSGGSTDSAFTESLTSVHLQSSTDDRPLDPEHSSPRPHSCSLLPSNLSASLVEPLLTTYSNFQPLQENWASQGLLDPSGMLSLGKRMEPVDSYRIPPSTSFFTIPLTLDPTTVPQVTSSYIASCNTSVNHHAYNNLSTAGTTCVAVGSDTRPPLGFSAPHVQPALVAISSIPPIAYYPYSVISPYASHPKSVTASLYSTIPSTSDGSQRRCSLSGCSDGLIIVGTAQQIKDTLSSVPFPTCTNPTVPDQLNLDSTHQTHWQTIPSHPMTASFVSDSPLRLDAVEPLCLPPDLSSSLRFFTHNVPRDSR